MSEKRVQKQADKIIENAKQEAERIILEAQLEAERLAGASAFIETVKKRADEIKEFTRKTCSKMKNDAKQLQEKILKEETSIYSIYRYGMVRNIRNDLWAVADIKTEKVGCIDINGNQIIPCKYSEVLSIYSETNDIAISDLISNNFCYGLADNKGNVLIEPKYTDVQSFSFHSGLWIVKSDGKWGAVDRNDNVFIPFMYDKISPFYEDTFEAELNGETFYINKNGERIDVD